jgi:3-hydroxyacyl-CoA dehydrogenase
VVRAKDTPNFVANRVGIAGMLATIQEAENFGLGFDVVDDLTGKKLGRASSGTFRTADVVGLDTMAHVIKTLQDNLPTTRSTPATPRRRCWQLIEKGALGQKTGAGFYKKVGKDILRLDPKLGQGRVRGKAGGKADADRRPHAEEAAGRALKLLRESSNPQAQFLWAILRDSFHYCAVHLDDIADTARDVDFAMRWGFGMKQGPFELWQAAGWTQVAQWVEGRHRRRQGAVQRAAAGLGVRGPVAAAGGVHTPEGSWSPAQGASCRAAPAGLLQRQPSPRAVLGSGRAGAAEERHRGVQERRGARLDARRRGADRQHHRQAAPDQPGRHRRPAQGRGDRRGGYQGLVIWSPDDVFSAGANLESLMPVFMKLGAKGIAPEEKKLQDAMLRIRYAQVPVVARPCAAWRWAAAASWPCTARAAWRHMESYVGLVEVGVGLIPGGGGLAYIARRAAEMASAATGPRRPAEVPDRRLHRRRDGQGGHQRDRGRKLGYLLWTAT